MRTNFFLHLGLTDNEQKIYLFLLEYGHSIASMVGKRLEIKRVTVYASLEALKRKELVTTFQKNGVTYFEAASPEDIVAICRKKTEQQHLLEKEAIAMLPALEGLHTKQSKPFLEVKGKLKYYQGIDAVKQLISETLEEGPKEQFVSV